MRIQTPKIKFPNLLGFIILVLCWLIIVVSACKETPNLVENTSKSTETPTVFDTSYAAKFRPVDKGNIPIQTTSNLKGTLEKRKINDYTFEATIVDTFPLKNVLTRSIPGEKGIPMPQKKQLTGKKMPASHNPPRTVLPPFQKTDAEMDVQFINRKHGLESVWVNHTAQDKKGNIWIGYEGAGLSKYSGLSYTHFSREESLCGLYIGEIIEDKNGGIWILSYVNGFCHYDGHQFTQYDDENGVLTNQLTNMILDREGTLWVGSVKGVFKFDGRGFSYNLHPLIGDQTTVPALLEDQNGDIWFGTQLGNLIKYDGVGFWDYSAETNFEHSRIETIYQTKNGDLWIGTCGAGIFRFDGKQFQQYYFEYEGYGNCVYNFAENDEGQLWIHADYGLFLFDENYIVDYDQITGLNKAKINHLELDKQGILWLSTQEYGLVKIKENSFRQLSEIDNISLSHFQFGTPPIEEDGNGNLLIGTEEGLIKMKDGEYSLLSSTNGLQDNDVYEIFVASDNTVWVALLYGINKINGQNITYFEYGIDELISPKSFFQDTQQKMWLPTSSPYFIDQNQNHFFYNVLDNDSIIRYTYKHLEDKANNIWFVVENTGIAQYDGENLNWFLDKRFRHSNVIEEDQFGNIWVGTNYGLAKLDGHQFHFFTEKDGLNSSIIYEILADKEGRIWASTDKGISLLIPQKTSDEAIDYSIRTYGIEDGIKKWDILERVFLDSKNTLWWVDRKGLTFLDLDKFKLNDHQPILQLDQIQIKQQHIDFRQLSDSAYVANLPFGKTLAASITDSFPKLQNYPAQLSLPYKLNHLTFQFSAIDWDAPHKLKYSYFLEGQDDDWSLPNTNHSIELRGIPHGTYTLKAKAIGAGQKWSEETAYTFTILPPWYYSNWAYTGYMLLFLGVLFLAYALVMRRLRLQNQLAAEQREANRLKELDSFKSRLFTNITHEFRTPLTVILGMAKQIMVAPKENVAEAAKLISNNGQNLLRLINQLLDLSKLENNAYVLNLQQANLVAYIRYLVESFHSFTNNRNLSLRFYTTFDTLLMDFDPETIKQLMTNLISNAVKFTPSGGDITVQLFKHNQHLIVGVEDTGIGIEPSDLPHIFDRFYQVDNSTTRPGEGTGIGLAHSKELVKIMGGTISVTSTLGKGSNFRIQLPIRNQAAMASEIVAKTPISALSTPPPHPTITSITPPTTDLPQLLLIEDNPDVVVYLKTCLKGRYGITVAYNGKIGIKQAIEQIPDLIISDVMMPEKDGYQVCQALKNDERTCHIPIILLTAKADIDSKITGLKTGADAYLAKPFDQEELLVRLALMLELRQKLQAYYTRLIDKTANVEEVVIEDILLQKIKTIIEKELSNALFNPIRLSRTLGLSQSQMYRKIKALTNTTPALFIRSIRLQKGLNLLKTTDLTVSEIAYEVGFTDPAYFSRTFSAMYGSAPNDNRK